MKSWNSGKGRNIDKLTKELLHQKIEVEGYAISRLAKELDCNRNSIYIKMNEFNIKSPTKDQIKNSQREMMVKRFGGPSPFSSQKTQETKRKTLKEKYGVENVSQIPEVQNKIKQTNLEKYGVKSFALTKKFQDKKNESLIKKYGTTNLFSLKEIQQKSKQTMRNKYGVSYNFQRQEVKEKSKQSMIDKYGVDNPFKSKIIQNKIQDILKEKYKTEIHPFKRESVKNKISQTNIKKYGVKTPLLLEENQKKSREAFKEKYGYDSNFTRPEVRKKSAEHSIFKNSEVQKRNSEKFKKKYGYDNPFSEPSIKQKIVNTNLVKYGVKYIVEREDVREKVANTIYTTSKPEKQILEFVKSIYNGQIIENDRKVLNGKELDIYLPELSIAIEYNGLYWHSLEHFLEEGQPLEKAKEKHREKTKKCSDKNIRLIHIYAWEWDNNREMIETFLRFCISGKQRRIYARQCEVRNVDRKIYHDYCRKNHLQGAKSGTDKLVVLGLYYKDELVQLMSFDKPARSKKYQWEIIRGCPGSMNHVVGGNSKLFKHFIREYNPDNVMSKCDMDKFDGRGYYAMGMKLVKWDYRIYDVFIKEGHLKATSYHPRQEKNRLQREIDMKKGYHVSSAGTAEFVWTKE